MRRFANPAAARIEIAKPVESASIRTPVPKYPPPSELSDSRERSRLCGRAFVYIFNI